MFPTSVTTERGRYSASSLTGEISYRIIFFWLEENRGQQKFFQISHERAERMRDAQTRRRRSRDHRGSAVVVTLKKEKECREFDNSRWSEARLPSGGVGGGFWGLRPPATKWGTKGGSPRWFVTYHGSVSDELLLFIFFILIHGDGDWFFLERFFVFYQSIESLISQSFSVFHIGDRVIIHDFIKVSSSTFFKPGGWTPSWKPGVR